MTESDLQPILVQAFAHHQAGRLAQAEQHYRQILHHDPNHANALHLLGVLAQQVGRHEAAVELISRAVALRPAVAEFQSNLGLALQAHGNLPAAADCFRKAVALKPDFPTAYNNLGSLLRSLGQFDAAIDALRQAIALKPDYADAHNNLGNALQVRGDLDLAVASFQAALRLTPGNPSTLNNLGNTLRLQGNLPEALAVLQQALAAKPDFAEARHNLGNTLLNQGRIQEAAAAFREAFRLKPEMIEAAVNLAAVLRDLGHLDEALAVLHRALAARPDHPDACNTLGTVLLAQGNCDQALAAHRRALLACPQHLPSLVNLGIALRTQGNFPQAADAFRAALQLRPELAEAHAGLGGTLLDQEQLDPAADALREALRLKPETLGAWVNLGNVLKSRGEIAEAITAYRAALQRNPRDLEARSNLIYTLHFDPAASAHAILEEARAWDALHALPLADRTPHDNDPNPDRCLRVGYVSADFRSHPVGQVFLPLALGHDRRHVCVICYSSVRKPDPLTERTRALADQWHDVADLSADALASQIRRDRIDILVDLSNHLAGNRLLTFARRPAPVQIAMLNSTMTTGLSAIDHRLSDPHCDPPGSDSHYSEATLRLPASYFCRETPAESPDPGPPPALAAGFITFGSLNNYSKVSPPVVAAWSAILQQLPQARLLLRCPPGSAQQKFLARMQADGISPDRIEFLGRLSRHQYLQAHQRIDIYLDPFPYCGHTTSLDALWMGVPLITLAGDHAVGRAGVLLLQSVNLPGLIASSVTEYQHKALSLARDPPRLAELRATLRDRLRASPLSDPAAYSRHVESAFRQIWRNHCRQSPLLLAHHLTT